MIYQLDRATIDKIAAGEVVERPGSVVKELLENSIDSGASGISIEIKNGGSGLIRVTDNGCGISKDDIPAAFLRHATSKLRSAEDLNHIRTMGFRGEALASIAGVSQLELITKQKDELLGYRYQIEGGRETAFQEVGAPDGTSIIVRNLFYNVPARRKFLKSAASEAANCRDLIEKAAFANPGISFSYKEEGRTVLNTSGNGRLLDVIYTICGRSIVNELIEVDYTGDVRIKGYIGKPSAARAKRDFEIYFVNSRYIKSAVIGKAIEDAFKPYLMQHRFPFCVLMIDAEPEKIDVNVHPRKMEVRFSDNQAVYNAVAEAVTYALKGDSLIPDALKPVPDTIRPEPAKENAPEPFERSRASEGGPKSLETAKLNESTPNPFDAAKLKESAPGTTGTAKVKETTPDLFDAAKLKENTLNRFDAASVKETTSDPFKTAKVRESSQNTFETTKAKENSPNLFETARTKESAPVQLTLNELAAGYMQDKTAEDRHHESAGREAAGAIDGAYPEIKKESCSTDIPEENILTAADKNHVNAAASGNNKHAESETDIPGAAAFGPKLRLIGQVFDTYWIAECGSELFIIDQHAAHEKVNYERFMKQLTDGNNGSQMIYPPIMLHLNAAEASMLRENLQSFEELGYEIEDTDNNDFVVRAVPVAIKDIGDAELLGELIDSLCEERKGISSQLMRDTIASMSCKAAVKGNRRLSFMEIEALLQEMLKLENPYNCPHGRPTVIKWSKTELEKLFKRIV